MKYRKEIDGLRAIAVLPVLFYHLEVGVTGGYAGVDVFFVISGFLIITKIMEDLARESYSLTQFWARRIRRLFPALATVVGFVAAVTFAIYPAFDFKEVAQSIIAQSFLVANVYFFRESNYFGPATELMPMLHTWSLAVEEHFYLLFSICLPLLWKSKRLVVGSLIVLFLLSMGLSVAITHDHQAGAFYLVPTRIWEFIFGAFIAFRHRDLRSKSIKEIFALTGLLMLVFAYWGFDDQTPFPSWRAAIPCIGAMLIIYANSGGLTVSGRALAWPPLVLVGMASYSIYLWHWPLIVFAKFCSLTGEVSATAKGTLMVLSMLAGFASWRFIERPFRAGHIIRTNRQWYVLCFLLSMLFAGGAALVNVYDGMPSRHNPAAQELQAYYRLQNDSRFPTRPLNLNSGILPKMGIPGEADFVLWGDSHAVKLAPLLHNLASQHGLTGGLVAKGGEVPYLARAQDRSSPLLDFLRKKNIKHVIMAARWELYVEQEIFWQRLKITLEEFDRADIQCYLLSPIPSQSFNVHYFYLKREILGSRMLPEGITLEAHRNKHVREQSYLEGLRSAGVTLLDIEPYLFDDTGRSILQLAQRPAYFDDNHLSPAGAGLLSPLLESVLDEISAR